MESSWTERDEDATVVGSPKRVLHYKCQISTESYTAALIENMRFCGTVIGRSLNNVATPIRRREGEDKFDGIDDRLASKNIPPKWFCPTTPAHQPSWSIPFAISSHEPIDWRYSCTVRAAESGPDAKVLAVMQTGVNRLVVRAFQSSASSKSVDRAVKKYQTELLVANDVMTRTIEIVACTVPVVKFLENEVENHFIQYVELNVYRSGPEKTVVVYRLESKDKFPP